MKKVKKLHIHNYWLSTVMFQLKQTEFLAISMKYFFDCANILEVKMYNNTLLINKTKELI